MKVIGWNDLGECGRFQGVQRHSNRPSAIHTPHRLSDSILTHLATARPLTLSITLLLL